MTEAEWLNSNDAYCMLKALWQIPQHDLSKLQRQLHRYYLACGRAIWRLLPQEDSRLGIEVGEQYLAGKVNDKELNRVNWYVEGAAFTIDYNTEPEAIKR